MRIIEISSQALSASSAHMIDFAKAKSLPWEVELFPAFDLGILNECSGALVDFSVSEQILSGISTLPTLVRMTECFDTFICEDGVWYPRLLLYEALRELITQKVKDLDNRSSGFIVGDSEEARVAAAVMVDLGISTIFVASNDEKKLSHLLKKLKRHFIGVNFVGADTKSVISQKVQSGFLINCMDLEKQEDLKNDLSYFNFMQRNGLVLDLVQANDFSLLEEAERAGLRYVTTADIFLKRDLLFLNRIATTAAFSENEFSDSWQAFLKSHPLSSYKKRHS